MQNVQGDMSMWIDKSVKSVRMSVQNIFSDDVLKLYNEMFLHIGGE